MVIVVALAAQSIASCSSKATSEEPHAAARSGVANKAPSANNALPNARNNAPPTNAPNNVGAASVLQHHKNASRDGFYVDPALTKGAAKTFHRDDSFLANISGPTYAQPLYLDDPSGNDVVFAATEQDTVYALDAATGAILWQSSLGTPVSRTDLPCGNIDPVGITGTPVIDASSRTLFVNAMTNDGGVIKHLIYALSIDDGSTRTGWPVEVGASATSNGVTFDAAVQNQRGALLIVGSTLYVPYGGHFGDCGDYRGWVVAVPLSDPSSLTAWATRAKGAGIWAPGGLSSDGASIFAATGNGFGSATWNDGEAIVRLDADATFSQNTLDYFSPTDWKSLDASDSDLGGSGPVLIDVPSATPSQLAVSLGKNGKAYLVDRNNLGGVSDALASKKVSTDRIINAAAAYTAGANTYVAFRGKGVGCPAGQSGDLTALKIGASSPPTMSIAWCANSHGRGSPIASSIDGSGETLVWSVGAEGDNRLRAFDGKTGAIVFDGGGSSDAMTNVRRFQTPMIAKGRVFVAADDQVFAFSAK
ncbi:MAG: hypothetical protein NVS3B20_02350 [Polyangiales bacterium]